MNAITRRAALAGAATLAAVPAAAPSDTFYPEIDRLMLRFKVAEAAWMATDGDDGDPDYDGPVYDEMWRAAGVFLRHQCHTDDEATYKLRLVLNDRCLRDCVEGDDSICGTLTFLCTLIPSEGGCLTC